MSVRMKRLKYCCNYVLPLFDQEQCYQFVIIDLRQLNFLLIAIYIWINVASKIAGFTTTATICIYLIFELKVQAITICLNLHKRQACIMLTATVFSKQFLIKPVLSPPAGPDPGCPDQPGVRAAQCDEPGSPRPP